MGLNQTEQEDFITYWCPIMLAYEYVKIHFLFNEDFDKYANLTINPKPDEVFRVFMLWSMVVNDIDESDFVPQKIPSFKRKGYTVVEWGGGKVGFRR